MTRKIYFENTLLEGLNFDHDFLVAAREADKIQEIKILSENCYNFKHRSILEDIDTFLNEIEEEYLGLFEKSDLLDFIEDDNFNYPGARDFLSDLIEEHERERILSESEADIEVEEPNSDETLDVEPADDTPSVTEVETSENEGELVIDLESDNPYGEAGENMSFSEFIDASSDEEDVMEVLDAINAKDTVSKEDLEKVTSLLDTTIGEYDLNGSLQLLEKLNEFLKGINLEEKEEATPKQAPKKRKKRSKSKKTTDPEQELTLFDFMEDTSADEELEGTADPDFEIEVISSDSTHTAEPPTISTTGNSNNSNTTTTVSSSANYSGEEISLNDFEINDLGYPIDRIIPIEVLGYEGFKIVSHYDVEDIDPSPENNFLGNGEFKFFRKETIEDLTFRQLCKLAKAINLKYFRRMRKSDLVEALISPDEQRRNISRNAWEEQHHYAEEQN